MQGKTFHEFVAKELDNERARRTALDARGVGIVTASASLATLVAGLSAVATQSSTFAPSVLVVVTALSALAVFVLAAALGIWANRTIEYRVADSTTLTQMATERWTTDEVDALNVVVTLNITTLTSLREGNNRKAMAAVLAMIAQLTATALLTVSAAGSLLSAM